MKKALSIIALLLCALMLLSACNGVSSSQETDTTDSEQSESVGGTESESNESGDADGAGTQDETKIVKVYNAGQLMNLIELSKMEDYAETSKNTVFQLQADIDLNEGWSAAPTLSGDEISALPEAPENVWQGIPKFYGTLDGNGKTIRGIYMYADVKASTSMGFINELCGGTVKNLTVENSIVIAEVAEGVQNVNVGVLVGSVSEVSVIENVTVNANVCVSEAEGVLAGVLVGKTAEGTLTKTGVTENGEIYPIPDDPSIIRVSTAEELLAAFEEHGDFEGKTLKLTADIDLNPNWDASVTIGDTVVFPEAPATVWPEIATFKGTLDGNGHIIRGIYKSMTARGGSGEHGGMFKTFEGTIKNLAIVNSFIITTNSDWGSKNVRVGGIAGTVKAGATLTTVYMDIEVWYKSHEGCMLGGAFGGADGQYNVDGYIFEGRVGHTNLSNALTFTLASGKNIWMGQLTGNQNWKEDNTLKNVAVIGEKFVGAVDSGQSGFIGADLKWNYVHIYTGKKDLTYEKAQSMLDGGWVWNETLECLIPSSLVELVATVYAK